ncbi:LacI family DNA-binding transcriptional regulator [Bifidobacterium sp. 82T10]|uniref:LacI family DNA-binding transcriptional regulator n=1 Tax=Bifidobacterium miconis TaxID=2834435 RepID=A0ABS6WEU3_9BIFI|nr:LacI family DNA-binding transcriptional regulator [Bifidobacterium miconis]MBW3092462.1 LacI family DNA-binding transcriptional regulator [Bifidobacterium miconis]
MANGKTTLRDVAAAAGVSPMTASNALHGKAGVKESTRAKVLAAAERLDYRINLTASMLKSGRSNIIHIIVNEFDSPFYSKLVQALATATTERGLTPFVEQTRYSPTAAERALTRNPFSDQLFDGEIIHASGLGTNLPLARMNAGRPLVLIDGCEETPSVDTVNFPNEDGARAAVQHLIERGCRHIAIVGGEFVPRAELAHVETSYGLRLRGASGALLDAGLAYDESIMFYGYNSDYGIKAGHAIGDAILAVGESSGRPFDGVFCANDYAAFGVIRGLKDRGLRVPDDVKVIGIDGTSFGAYSTPTLSTIQVDLDQLAQFALDMITRRIERRNTVNGAGASTGSAGADTGSVADASDQPTRATIGYRLIARESTGA